MNGLALYSGYAGLDIGLALAEPGFRTVCHVEREAAAAANLVARMEAAELHPAPVWDDSGTFDGRPWRGVVDIVTAGFPCPEVSIAGRRKGVHGERWLWGDVARIVRQIRPRWLLLENVRGILSVNDGGAHAQVLGDLAEMGFDVVWGSVPAGRLGASHGRDRIFYVADATEFGRRTKADDGRASAVLDGGSIEVGISSVSGQRGYDGWRAGSEFADGRKPMGDHPCARGRGIHLRPGRSFEENEDPDWYGGGLPPTPPGPEEDDAWLRIIEQHGRSAEALPAIHRMADGTSTRLDRIRLCGNGVFPLAAAYAWLAGRAALAAAADARLRQAA